MIIFLSISLNMCFGAQKNRLSEVVLLSTHNICFGWEIRKIMFRYTPVSGGLAKGLMAIIQQYLNKSVLISFSLLCNIWTKMYKYNVNSFGKLFTKRFLSFLFSRQQFITIFFFYLACDFQQGGILTSVDSDEPVQPPFKLRNSKWCSVSSLTLIDYLSD